MTVKEVIEKLNKFPGDATVYIETKNEVYTIKKIKLWVCPEDKGLYQCDIFATRIS